MKKFPAFLNTPARLVIAVASIILGAELLIMLLINGVFNPLFNGKVSNIFWGYLDPVALVVLVSPALYILIFKPMDDQQAEIERQLVELRRNGQLAALIEAIPDSIFLKDGEGRWLVTNEPAKQMFQLHGLPWQGKTEMELADMNPAFRAAHEGCLAGDEKAWQAGRLLVGEESFAGEDGRCVIIETRKMPLFGENGQRKKLVVIGRDITERKRLEDALLQQKQFSDDIINSLPGIFYMLDTGGRFVRVSSQFLVVTGYAKEELDRMTELDLFEGNDKNLIAQRMREVFEKGDAWVEAEIIIKSGRHIPFYFTGHRVVLDGRPYLVGLGTDITERRVAEENMRITAGVFDISQEAILISDASNVIMDVNPAFTRITGYSREEVLGGNPKLLSSGRHDQAFYAAMWQSLKQERVWRGEIWNRRKSGEIYAALLSISDICDDNGKVLRHVGVFSDISHLKEREAELNRVAHYDALTGIPNRVLLADRMKQAIAQTAREQTMMAICYLDLDGFKPINDTLGHEAGDQVLIEVARRIENTIRGGDTVARLGGDEFVVLLLGMEKGEECVTTLERLLGAIAQPILVKGNQIALGASIGVSIYPLDDEDPDTLLRHADQAMYVAKQSGKNRFYIYDFALDQRARNRNEFVQSIRSGLEFDQFELYYQPKINLRTRQLAGAEALIRWRHPERGLLLPAEFLRHVENTDLDIEIGEWVIATVLAQMRQWRNTGLDIEVSINISGYHLESPRFVQRLQQQLAHYPDIPFGKLQIEVLETVALNDIAVVREIIEACRRIGVGFALDDFGTGYSSLTYLSSLPIDALKIDQSFVRDMLEDKGDMAIVLGIIALAQAFNRQTVAEGIETEAHYRALLDMGCEIGQGYGIARPMPSGELARWQTDSLKGRP